MTIAINSQLNVDTHKAVTIAPMKDANDQQAFYDLNVEWITAHFELEESDLDILHHPQREVIGPGGQVYLAYCEGRAVGCVALMAYGPGIYKIAKMAVTPEYRGKGIGRKLLLHAIEQARSLRARTLFLASSDILVPAIGLYETVGFQRLSIEEWPFMRFARANVFMRMHL
ncbi:GNAT family N-acetyltransferase [Deinococcus hopiensis]|uniref:N-acetylglutamate synthase and related acetyltransferases n=1 Tax=Deinococcus hopiensis KR-140 TaxID=695939 RepID=A0A1W1UT37_9DEIO|nr:GNAT family N-acetyltransferase [Deinococcus hopiensis]SMB84169.1 N-acetylglutamate synthase and related acetyltransferases [Deinococcus hopiensis KR-140]